MKPGKISLIVFVSLAVFATVAFVNKMPGRNAATNKGFAVIELFTSEGCSSCPSADNLVAKIQKEYNGQSVYILAYHVDYWNRLGWKDEFSNASYSKRQHDYMDYLHTDGVYTPQIVINGSKEFVGSEEGTLRSAIKAGLQKTTAYQLALSGVKIEHRKLSVHYQLQNAESGSVLLLALIQHSAQTQVKAGENKGRTLSHVQIVRDLQTTVLNGKSGTASVDLPAGFNAQNFELTGIIQNMRNGAITAAVKIGLPNETN
jgi:hypothetical protein